MKKRIAVLPGSFDPITLGHVSIVDKAYDLFDEIIVAVGENTSKKTYFSLEQRMAHLKATFEGRDKIRVERYSGLTIDFCKKNDAQYLIRGLRDSKDFQYEKSIAIMNTSLSGGIETVFFMTEAAFAAVNSSIIRDVLKHGGDAGKFLPKAILPLL